MTDFVFSPEAPADETLTPAVDGVYVQNEAHVEEGISHLIDFFRSGPRNQAEMAAYLEQVQEVEDEFWALRSAFDPDTAVGDQLQLLGRLVGEPRLGRVDDDYRAAIRVRLLVNNSDGQLEQLYEICEGLFPAGMAFSILEFFPASLAVYFTGDPGDVTIASVDRLLKLAKAGGVRLDTVFENPGGEDGFVWSADATPVASSFGWGSNTDAAVGGVWGSVM